MLADKSTTAAFRLWPEFASVQPNVYPEAEGPSELMYKALKALREMKAGNWKQQREVADQLVQAAKGWRDSRIVREDSHSGCGMTELGARRA